MKMNRKALLFYEAPLAETITISIEKSILSGNGNDIGDGSGIPGPDLSRRRDDDYEFNY